MASPLISVGMGKITGLREVNAAFRRIERQVQRDLIDEMLTRAKPVAETSKGKISAYPGAKVSTIRAARGRGGAVVRQGAGSTHSHPNFGSIQIVLMLEAISEHSAEIYRGVEHMLAEEIRRAGF